LPQLCIHVLQEIILHHGLPDVDIVGAVSVIIPPAAVIGNTGSPLSGFYTVVVRMGAIPAPALGAVDDPGEQVGPVRIGSPLRTAAVGVDLLKLRPRDIRGAHPVHALEAPAVRLLGQHEPGQVVGEEHPAAGFRSSTGLFNGSGGQEALKKAGHRRLRLRVLDHLLALDLVPRRNLAGAGLLALLFGGEHRLDPLAGPVRLVLGYAEHDIDLQSPRGGGGVVVLVDGLPVYAVALQDFLDLVIFSYVPKPAVQLGEDNQVNQAGLHVREQPLKLRTLRRALAGGDAGINVVPGHLDPRRFRPGVQSLPLGLDG